MMLAFGLLAAGVLVAAYWREALTVPVNSDGAANALQAWSMLHGNVLLHGWWVSDISFYTTELPQYVLIEAVAGLGPAVVHMAAAMTYTLIVVLLTLIARGNTAGREGWYRGAVAAVIVIAPLSAGAAVLLANPDHTGTMVPVLLTWLVIDRGQPGAPGRWPVPGAAVPAVVWLLVTLTMVADKLVLLALVAPLVLAVAIRAALAVLKPRQPGRPGWRALLAARWYELWLAGAALAGAGTGWLAQRAISSAGGYQQYGTMTGTVPPSLHGAWVTFRSVLLLFGADVFGSYPAAEIVLAAVHLAGAAAAVYGLCVATARFSRADGIAVPALAVSFGLIPAAYLLSVHSKNMTGVREMVAVLPAGAVLAARAVPLPRLAATSRVPAGSRLATAVLATGYLAALAYGVTQPPVRPYNSYLAAWLTAHHLTCGLAGYWVAASTTLDTHGRVLISGIRPQAGGRLAPYDWETDTAGYNPHRRTASFVVTGGPIPTPGIAADAIRTFGHPSHIIGLGGYTIMIWTVNLLRYLG